MSRNMITDKIGNIIDFNPNESLPVGSYAKKIAMGKLIVGQRKINGYEFSVFSSGAKFKNGDTLLAKITPCLENGKTAQVDILEDNEVAFGSTEFIVLRETDKIDKNYLFYLARSPHFRQLAITCMEGTSGRKRVSESSLQLREITIHKNKEKQQRIAKVLSDIDKKIEVNDKIIKELESMAKGLYDYWFVQFDFPDANGKPYRASGGKMTYTPILKREIPDGWKVKTLLDIAVYTNGLACQNNRPNKGEQSLPVIKIKEMHNGFSNETERVSINIPEKVKVYDGDILFSWSASLEVMIWAMGAGGLNQHIFKVTSENYPREYYYFQLLDYVDHFKKIAEARKTTMGHITQEHLEQSRIVVPENNSIINQFAKQTKSIIDQIVSLTSESIKLFSTRDWLLPILMNGQVTIGESTNKANSDK